MYCTSAQLKFSTWLYCYRSGFFFKIPCHVLYSSGFFFFKHNLLPQHISLSDLLHCEAGWQVEKTQGSL